VSILAIAAAVALIGVDKACYDAMQGGQMPGNTCSHEYAREIEDELNRVWQLAVPVIRRQDAEWVTKFDNPGYFDKVLEEQRAWIRYREAVCDLERFSWYDGSGAPYAYNKCMSDMAIERIKSLKIAVESEG